MKRLRHYFSLVVVVVAVLGCNQQTEVERKKTKDDFLPLSTQIEIRQQARSLFANFDNRMLGNQNTKITSLDSIGGASPIDSLIEDPSLYLSLLLQEEVEPEYPEAYKEFISTEEGKQFVSPDFSAEESYEDYIKESPEFEAMLNVYFQRVEETLSTLLPSNANNDLIDVEKGTYLLEKVTKEYEEEIINNEALSENVKFLILSATTYILANPSDWLTVAGNLVFEEYENGRGGRFWRGLARVFLAPVKVVVSLVTHVVRGVINGIVRGVRTCWNGSYVPKSGFFLNLLFANIYRVGSCAIYIPQAIVTGAIVGSVTGIVRVFQNRCMRLNGTYRPCF